MNSLVKTMQMHHDWKGTCTAVFQENPCARMKNTYFCKDLRAPLSSPLFKRILQREYEKCLRPMVVKDPCHRHFYRESCSENQKSKNSKQKKHATIQTRNRKPRQQKAQFGGPMFYLRLKETFFKMYEIPCARTRKKSPPWSTWSNNNYLLKK